jgi:ABC-2 type transport system permease protein
MGSTLTFWTVQPVEAVNILTYGGNELMTYPASIYPVWLQRFFTYVVPFVFLNYYPALYFLDKPDPLGLIPVAPFLAPFASAAMLAFALLFWRFGLDHYQSTGS